jgi:diguanylate cyclase (GGDEF)-like protein
MARISDGQRAPVKATTPARFAVASGLATAIYAFNLLGDASELIYTPLMLAAVGAIGMGLWKNQPKPRFAWSLMFPISFLFAAGIAVREATGQNVDIGRSTIAPDLLTVPGYLLFGLMLVSLIRSRQAGRFNGLLLDGAMFGAGSLLIFYVLLIQPVLDNGDYSLVARVTFSIYPPLSASLVLLAARLAFTPGHRSVTLRYFLLGIVMILVGDVTQFLAETQTVVFPLNTTDIPYLLAYTFMGAAYLHPSIRRVANDEVDHAPPLQTMRFALAASLLIPCLLLLLWRPSSRVEQTLVGGLAVALAGLGALRLIVAVRAQTLSEAKYAHRATHDALTGLPNRELLLERIEAALHSHANDLNVTVVLIDVDRFKLVNDTLGHRAGDELLLEVGRKVQAVVGTLGTVGRVSGDEFVVVLGGLSLTDSRDLAEAICSAFTAPVEASGAEVYLTVSIGLAHTDDAARSPVDLLREADTAVYRSKEAGRNAVTVYQPEMLEVDSRRVELEHGLRHALGAGGLEVHYQPIVSLTTGAVEGFEALARWHNGEQWVPPMEFVHVAEESGLIGQLGTWILRESCRQIARWRTIPELAHATVSVNLSARQLTPDLVGLVDDTLTASGLPGEALWLEITESMMVQDSDDLQSLITDIHGIGVRLSLDDFGTGFSSLSYLRSYHLDRLKIDRSFVSGLTRDEAEGSLADAIVGIGRSLRIGTVAEGIETPEEALAIQSLGCSLGQGYYFAKPMAPSQVPLALNAIRHAWDQLGLTRLPAR